MDLSELQTAAAVHWLRAEQDLQDCRELLVAAKPGWALTALLYSALHLVNAYLVQEGRRPTSHDLRDRLVAQELPSVAEYYLELKRRSERVRYWPEVQVTEAEVRRFWKRNTR